MKLRVRVLKIVTLLLSSCVGFLSQIGGAIAQQENPLIHEHRRQLPNDAEQKASYCLAVIKLQVSEFSAYASSFALDAKVQTDLILKSSAEKAVRVFKKEIGESNDKINRLQSFLLPRIPYLESTAMLTAYARGEADFRRQQASSTAETCMAKCKDEDFAPKCMSQCMEQDELSRRIFQCRDLSFLPY